MGQIAGQWQVKKVIQISLFYPDFIFAMNLEGKRLSPASCNWWVHAQVRWFQRNCIYGVGEGWMSHLHARHKTVWFFFKRPHKHLKAASLSGINTFSSQSPGPQHQEILNRFLVLYCVIIYKFHSVATFDLCREKLPLNPWIRLYLAPACLTTNKDNLWFHKDYIPRLLSCSTKTPEIGGKG